ncbi:hypothetical protein HZC00_01135 [Candidatus Kaiserbacteria bacterium]|nr:hypothetical protein [Candidatus Kaiserbacteria bacterium]
MEKDDLRLLGLSRKEEKVLVALQDGEDTPLTLARATRVSRTAVYAILQQLKKRGLVRSHITDGRKSWHLTTERDLEEVLYATKRALLKIPEGREEIRGVSDSMVVVHRGVGAIKKVMFDLFSSTSHERFFWGFQGDTSTIGWNKVFTVAETNRINREIKKNGIITQAILPKGWFENQTKLLGVEWAKDFEGRTARVNVLDPKYFKHGGQVFIIKNSVYLFALNEEIVIEVRNSEIQRMMKSIFEFIQENSDVIDANAVLRGLLGKREN